MAHSAVKQPVPPPNQSSNDAMAAMMKAHGQGGQPGQPSAPPASGGANDPAALMKAHQQAGAAGAANAGGAAAPAAVPAAGHGQAGGANPAQVASAPAGPGLPGGTGLGGPGGVGMPNLTPGSPEEVLFKFCAAMADSNLTDAGQYVSPKAKGLLLQIREGTMTDEKIDSLKASFSLQGLTIKPSRPVSGSGKQITLSNKQSENLSFTLMKEDDAYLLREFKVSKSTSR
jgi:hypothetical protein